MDKSPIEKSNALGWHSLKNTKLASVCPEGESIRGTMGCAAVISAWSGAAADTKRNRLLIWGGGHTDYYGNEVYALELIAPAIRRITEPTLNPVDCAETQPDGRPASRHTYYGLAYLTNVDKFLAEGGSPACKYGGGTNATWILDMATLQWTLRNPLKKPARALSVALYDSNTNLVFVEDLSNLYKYDFPSDAYTQLSSVGSGFDYHLSGVIDPTRKLLFFTGGPGQLWAVNIAAGSNYTFQNWSSRVSGCEPLMNGNYPGLTFDARQKLVVGWVGGDSVYLFNPDTKSCTAKTYSGGPGAAQPNGTNGRFAYFPSLNLFLVVNDWQQDAYVLRLTQ